MQPIIAVQRFGLGAAGGELARLGRDPRAALLSQLDQRPDPVQTRAPDTGLPDTATGVELIMRQRRLVQRRNQAAQAAAGGMVTPEAADFASPGQVMQADLGHRIEIAIATPAPLIERLALHWLNHFTVSATAVPLYVGYLGSSYEQEAVRPHILGRFEDMLFATATHPAMLCYLDNRTSTGPRSPRGLRRKVGLNENLGREILELHALGVDGGYTQDDVIGLARILTGWTIDVGINDTPDAQRLRFDPEMHEPGPQTVLGRRYPDTGPDPRRYGAAGGGRGAGQGLPGQLRRPAGGDPGAGAGACRRGSAAGQAAAADRADAGDRAAARPGTGAAAADGGAAGDGPALSRRCGTGRLAGGG